MNHTNSVQIRLLKSRLEHRSDRWNSCSPPPHETCLISHDGTETHSPTLHRIGLAVFQQLTQPEARRQRRGDDIIRTAENPKLGPRGSPEISPWRARPFLGSRTDNCRRRDLITFRLSKIRGSQQYRGTKHASLWPTCPHKAVGHSDAS